MLKLTGLLEMTIVVRFRYQNYNDFPRNLNSLF